MTSKDVEKAATKHMFSRFVRAEAKSIKPVRKPKGKQSPVLGVGQTTIAQETK